MRWRPTGEFYSTKEKMSACYLIRYKVISDDLKSDDEIRRMIKSNEDARRRNNDNIKVYTEHRAVLCAERKKLKNILETRERVKLLHCEVMKQLLEG